jgi:hypothetical protein
MRAKSVPFDLETLPRSIRRKLLRPNNLSSYPLISGDSFAALCDYELQESDLVGGEEYLRRLHGYKRVFVGAKPQNDRAFRLAKYLSAIEMPSFKETDLVIHNGDEIPSEQEMGYLAHHFRNIYSVNYLGSLENVFPLPIGLENKSILRNGVPRDFLGKTRKQKKQRKIKFLFAFSTYTNTRERSEALALAPSLPGSFVVNSPITPQQYRKLIRQSEFVVSPPGNGPDCHRTWEAIYLGATPIVKREFWPFATKDLPVLEISKWSELTKDLPSIPTSHNSSWSSISSWLERPIRLK